jgi:hypothetical protein
LHAVLFFSAPYSCVSGTVPFAAATRPLEWKVCLVALAPFSMDSTANKHTFWPQLPH